jgi:hypothetical protein
LGRKDGKGGCGNAGSEIEAVGEWVLNLNEQRLPLVQLTLGNFLKIRTVSKLV